MARTAPVVIRCRGNDSITATHAKSFEVTFDDDLGPRATCVIGVGAKVSGDPAMLHGPVEITLMVAEHRQTILAVASPFLRPADGLVVRKSDFRDADTLAIDAEAAAADVDRAIVHALGDPSARLDISIRPVGQAPVVAVVTDQPAAVPTAPGLVVVPVVGLGAADPLPDADEVVATSALAQLAACAACAGGRATPDHVLVLNALDRRATPRKAQLAAARAQASVVLWRGPAGQAEPLLDLGPAAVAVDRGEVVTRIAGAAPERIPADAVVTVALAGDSAARADDLAPVLRALLAEGVTARTLRQALARLPHLGQWDYDAINRLSGPHDE